MAIKTYSFCEAKPFVKWAGGKRALLDSIISLMPRDFKNYFEPFVGGGALFFALQSKGLLDSKSIVLSDKNRELINAYEVIKSGPQSLLKELKSFQNKHNKDFFYTIRNLDRKEDFANLDSIFRAARFIYLNKTCFNGLCRYNAKGQFNTPMGSYKNPQIYNENLILNASNALQGVKILQGDFEEVAMNAASGDFVYFDPPYYPLNKTSSFVSYIDVFLEKEQKKLFEVFKALNSRGSKVLQSNSNAPFIRNLYKGFNCIEIQANRAINCKGAKRGKITELLIKGNYE
ncbi:DNA adenine methylase [Campylobacter cuniculorum]|uniref:Site-specific DNA-methyltransferase (adenine-specific) n=2 Tax=Campylobacter cuniculorum TaxID=374106 RepID=A0A1W6BUR1_9BACT|nr:DNA adenine methylase [Campylobacter cuniculorum]ARJ55830.1 adenine-specific DNA methyltransferase [Campylobacter cuniculorum DSM 23162 = LMG 24588]QOR05046.1 DNA adenine methylase [Campylobacter cuniculorum]